MQALDFSRLIQSGARERMMPSWATADDITDSGADGILFRSTTSAGRFVQNIVRISERAFLFASDHPTTGGHRQYQRVADCDWLHIQFRINGAGLERVAGAEPMATPENACIIAHYPRDSVIERHTESSGLWKVACLLISADNLADLLGISSNSLPCYMGTADGQSRILPLHPGMNLIVNDILACSFSGLARQAFMRGKSIELLSNVIHAAEESVSPPQRAKLTLSSTDLVNLARAHALMTSELDSTLTLANLAREVGLNRTKLALGFKEVYGLSVQAFWRDMKLNSALELLRAGNMRVTDVALAAGYTELSSFTRAFNRRFGVLPKSFKTAKQPSSGTNRKRPH